MARYLDPKNDLVFKKIFGRHPDLLISFLNAVLPLPKGKVIERLEYLPTENVPELPKVEKRSIVDVRCYDQDKRHFIVEMQMAFSTHFMQRFIYNVTSVYTRQLKIAEDYESLNPVYGLAIVHQKFSKESGWFHHYQFLHHQNHDNALDDIHLVLLELPKFEPQTLRDKKLTVLWLRFMTEIDETTQTVDPALFEISEIKEALALTEEAAYTSAELDAYARNWDAIRTERMLMNDSLAEGIEKGRKEGIEKGRKEGIEKGRKEGRKKEREKAYQEKLQVARNFLLDGLKPESVAKNTGLSLETVLAMQNDL